MSAQEFSGGGWGRPREREEPMRTRYSGALTLASLAVATFMTLPAWAADEKPPWDLKLGLSYLATSGNTDTTSAGFDGLFHRRWSEWEIEARANALRATQLGDTTAERYLAGLRGDRDLTETLALTAGAQWDRDRFAGINGRYVYDAGLKWTPDTGDRWSVSGIGALSWTDQRAVDRTTDTFLGGLLGAKAAYKLSESSQATADATFYPNFDTTKAWRLDADVGLQAAVSTAIALKVSYSLRYNNRPVEGFGKTDTSTQVSLVMQFAGKK
jgi:putative salt-induced outer membrane protein